MKYSTKAHSDEGQLDKMGETTVNSCRDGVLKRKDRRQMGLDAQKKDPIGLGKAPSNPWHGLF